MKRILRGLTLVLGVLTAAPVFGGDLTVARTVIADASGTLTFAEAVGQAGAPVRESLPKGSTISASWLRLVVHAPAHGTKAVLFIRPSYLNEVRLYEADPEHPGQWKTRVTGNDYPYQSRDRASVALGFVVNIPGPEATFYLNVHTKGPHSIDVRAVEPEEADRLDHQRDLLMVFFITSMLCILLWSILSYLLDHQRVVAFFAVHQAVYTLYGIAATGYLAPMTPANAAVWTDTLEAALYLGINFTLVLFNRELFRPYNPPPVLMRIMAGQALAFPVLLVALLTGHGTLAIYGNALLIKLGLLFFVGVAFTLRSEGTPSRRVLQSFFLVIVGTNVVFWSVDRLSPVGSMIHLSGAQTLVIDGLVIGGLFAWILHAHARQVLREGQRSAFELLLVQRKFEIELELKREMEIQAQTDELTNVCNRRRFLELAESELARAIRFRRPFSLLVIDIDHFKHINDTWGHSVGDEVLQHVAGQMRDTLRGDDLFGRIGGEEFAAALLESEGKEALDVAQRICSIVAGAQITLQDAGRIPVSVSIGLSELSDRSISLSELLGEADRAMYDAKEAGRNRTMVHDRTEHFGSLLLNF